MISGTKWQIFFRAALLFAVAATVTAAAQTPNEPAKQAPAAQEKPAGPTPTQTPTAGQAPVKVEKPQPPREKSW
ncbi:MAG TPA: hypothetical protein VK525_09625, partial [Candidatus Saccharimonadales bacterium]|nr:hypothetical protein [Candidatus Saccharimonadales bacterium]